MSGLIEGVSHMGTRLSAPVGDWFTVHLDRLSRRAEAARANMSSDDVDSLVGDLETAVEELRVAEEEIRTQSEHVTSLLESRDQARWRYERFTASLPVAVLTTDSHGRLRSVNPWAAALLGVRIDHLLGKPLFVFVDEPDRQVLRRALSLARQDESPPPSTVTLRSRKSQVEVVAYIGPVSDENAEVTWLLLEPDPAHPPTISDDTLAAPDPAAGLPAALLALSALSARGVDLKDVLQEAARVCAAALGEGAGVGICVGHPLDPQAVATTTAAIQQLDGWQMRAGMGPAVTAYDSGELVTAGEVLTDPRWPGLADGSAEPVGLCLGVPLVTSEGIVGVLTMILRSDDLAISTFLAPVVETLAAAVASLIQETALRSQMQGEVDDMRAALVSRSVIDQAKGVVMADQRCTAEEAFAHLVHLSNTTHRKVRDVAQTIVDQASA
jgi:PAS domain S-box-containing protein